ncbi:MAG: ABC transporter ATP-binding protein/permease [Firmicutes bacterium]|nr:ABC transporter ATP-binding protein/permease [Bacillota bacterium]
MEVRNQASNIPQKGLIVLSEDDEYERRPFDGRLLKRVLAYLAPYRRQVAVTALLALLAIGAALALPYILKIGIDQYIAKKDPGGVIRVALLYLGVAVVQYWGARWQGLLMVRIGQRAIFDLRRDLFQQTQSLSLNFFDRQKSGRIMLRITNDISALEELLSSGVSTAFADSVTLVGLLGVMLWLDWRMTLIICVTLPLIIWVAVFLRNRMLKVSREMRRQLSGVNANLNESLMGIRVTQAFGREEVNAGLFRNVNRRHFEAAMKFVPLNAFFWPWIGLLNTIGTASVLLVGGFLLLSGAITLGIIAAFMNYINRFFQPIQNLSNLFNVVSTAMASCERIFEILDLKPEVADPPKPQPVGRLIGAVEFRQVDFSYNGLEFALKGFNLEVKPGEVIALVGPTGAGKTTVINLLTRFYDPTRGQVLVDGKDLRTLSQAEYRKQIGVVLQDSFIFSGTIAGNIRYGKPEASREEIMAAAKTVGIHDYILSLPDDYDTQVQERGGGLSMGQRQLIAFARALIRDPRIIILDEATANIDTMTEQALQEALARLLKGRTAFIIAHRLSTIRNADRILVIDNGRLAEAGNHFELLKQNGIYAGLYESQYRAG